MNLVFKTDLHVKFFFHSVNLMEATITRSKN